jgi:hypothetical protein
MDLNHLAHIIATNVAVQPEIEYVNVHDDGHAIDVAPYEGPRFRIDVRVEAGE